jgi:hypothetical protein
VVATHPQSSKDTQNHTGDMVGFAAARRNITVGETELISLLMTDGI